MGVAQREDEYIYRVELEELLCCCCWASLVAFCTNLVVIIRQQYFVVVVVVVRDALRENWEISAVADDFSFCVMKIAIS